MTAEPLVLSVTVERDAPAGQASAVESVLARYGIDADVRQVIERRGGDAQGWIVEVAIVGPMAAFFASFGSTFGTTAANDAYPLVKEWIKALWAARGDGGAGEGCVEITSDDGTTLLVRSSIPDTALEALADVPWERVAGRFLAWDEAAGAWTAASARAPDALED